MSSLLKANIYKHISDIVYTSIKKIELHINSEIIIKISLLPNMSRIVLLFLIIASIISMNYGTPLDDYVNKPDPTFSWKRIQIYPFSTHTIHILNMTSQQWFNGMIICEEDLTI